jgi:hypothetical protein
MAKPTVAIRVAADLYDELVKIADDRDVTITQALDIYIRRQSRGKAEEASEAKPKKKAKAKAKANPAPASELETPAEAKVEPEPKAKDAIVICDLCGNRVRQSKLQAHKNKVHRVK